MGGCLEHETHLIKHSDLQMLLKHLRFCFCSLPHFNRTLSVYKSTRSFFRWPDMICLSLFFFYFCCFDPGGLSQGLCQLQVEVCVDQVYFIPCLDWDLGRLFVLTLDGVMGRSVLLG